MWHRLTLWPLLQPPPPGEDWIMNAGPPIPASLPAAEELNQLGHWHNYKRPCGTWHVNLLSGCEGAVKRAGAPHKSPASRANTRPRGWQICTCQMADRWSHVCKWDFYRTRGRRLQIPSPSSRTSRRLNISFSTGMHNWGARVPFLKVTLPYWTAFIINVCTAHSKAVRGLISGNLKSLCRFKFRGTSHVINLL